MKPATILILTGAILAFTVLPAEASAARTHSFEGSGAVQR